MLNDALPDEMRSPLLRRLATILAADVAGYSRMMGEDEEATVQTFRGHRAVFETVLKQHYGRIFNTAGDAILAEFPSAVEAVRCATEIQAALETRNQRMPPGRKMFFRMGINLGDVVVQGDDLLGDGVNVAARLQTLAEPGGVCISGSVYDQIQNKLSLRFTLLGDQNLKNIDQPIRSYLITHGETGALPSRSPLGSRLWLAISTVAVVAVVSISAGAIWLRQSKQSTHVDTALAESAVSRPVAQAAPISTSAASRTPPGGSALRAEAPATSSAPPNRAAARDPSLDKYVLDIVIPAVEHVSN